MSNIKISIKNKKAIVIVIAFVVGIILLLCGTEYDNKKKITSEVTTSVSESILYSESLEKKIEDFLRTVNGINSAEVFVTIDSGNELQYAAKGSSEGNPSDYLIINTDNGEEAAVVRQIYPQVRGIAVSCTNGNNATVKEEVISLLSAALGISTNKISVTGYDK